jgi:hypothetical protein
MAQSLVKSFIWGLGRTAGNRSWKQIEKGLAKKVIDPNSNFRKQIQKFQLPGNPKSAIQKIWTLIDGFIEEYQTEKSMFQSTYKQSDIEFIERKLDRIYQMKMNDEEEDNFLYIQKTWANLKK